MNTSPIAKPVSVNHDARGTLFTEEFIKTDANWSYDMLTYNILRNPAKLEEAMYRIGDHRDNYKYVPLSVLTDDTVWKMFLLFGDGAKDARWDALDREAAIAECKAWILRAYARDSIEDNFYFKKFFN